MLGFIKIKALVLGLLLASPALAAWAYFGGEPLTPEVLHTQVEAEPAKSIRIPVEVIQKGTASKWVYVEVPPQSIPEPGCSFLIFLTGVLTIFRRRRASGISAE